MNNEDKFFSWLNTTFIQEAREAISAAEALGDRLDALCSKLKDDLAKGTPVRAKLAENAQVRDLTHRVDGLLSRMEVMRQSLVFLNPPAIKSS